MTKSSGEQTDSAAGFGHGSNLQTIAITVAYTENDTSPQLEEVSLEIVPGQLLAVIGPNGSGKSTLIRSLSRVLEPRRGVVCLDHRDLYHQVSAAGAAKQIAVVRQETEVAFEFTTREVISMGRAPYRTSFALFQTDSIEDEQAIGAAIHRVGLSDDQLDRPIMSLSGGERQRALTARALAQSAPIFLLDEPTSSLDLKHQSRLFADLEQMAHDDQLSIVVVLHDVNLAAAHADQIILMENGRIAAAGTPATVLTQDLLQRVYDTQLRVGEDPLTGRVTVNQVSRSGGIDGVSGKRIHVLSAAGSGATLIHTLGLSGVRVSVGSLCPLDPDAAVADYWNINYVPAEFYAPISPMTDVQLSELVAENPTVVLVAAFDAPASGSLITDALRMARRGLPLIWLTPFIPQEHPVQPGNGDVLAALREQPTVRTAANIEILLDLLKDL